MTPTVLYSRLHAAHTDLEAIHSDPQAIAVNWSIIAGAMADLSQEVKASITQESNRLFRLFGAHVFKVLEGGVAVLELVCNSDDDAEIANVIQLTDSAISGLCHTLQRCFLFEEPAHD